MKQNLKHIIAGLLIALAVGLPCWLSSNDLFGSMGLRRWHHRWRCEGMCDNNTDGNRWNWSDFGFTCIGVAIAMVVILAFHFGKG